MSARAWPDDDHWLQAIPLPVLALDDEALIVGCNTATAEAFGLPVESLIGRHFADAVLFEADRGGFAEIVALALQGHSWSGEFLAMRAGAQRLTQLSVSPSRHDGDVVGLVVVVESVGSTTRAVRLSERIARLATVATELVSADTVEKVTDVVVQHLADAAGATTASLSLLVDEDTLVLAGLRGGSASAATLWATYSLHDSTPAGDALRARETLMLPDREAIEARYPHLALAASGQRSLVCLPLVVAERPVGVVSLSFPGQRRIDHAELEFFRTMADSCAQALDRIRAQAEAGDQSARLTFLAQAGVQLGGSLDYASTLRTVAWLAVPQFADWCAIALEEGGRLNTLAVAHMDPEKLALAEEYQQRFPPDPEATTGSYQVLRTGESQLTAEITDEVLTQVTSDPEQLEMLRALDFKSGLVVPLRARGRTFGTMTWVTGQAGRRLGQSDVELAEQLGRRAGVAIDNAQLYSEVSTMADRLQRAVMPGHLPDVPGWRFEADYNSAGRTEVGGDFYDVIPVDHHRVALVIGDVMGRGVEAAASMGQVRAAVRTLVAIDPDPKSVIERLDLLYEKYPTEQLVTMAYVLVDTACNEASVAVAGHPAPIVLDRAGGGRFIDEATGIILGAAPREREAATFPFGPGQAIALYTDGLIERRGEEYDVGRKRLLKRLIAAQGTDLAAVVQDSRDPDHSDDVALLVAHRLRQ